MDEISVSVETRVIEVKEGGTQEWFVRPDDVGVEPAEIERIAGGIPEENAATVTRVLDGEDGPARDVVMLNAGAAIMVGGAAPALTEGMDRAREAIDSGAAREVLRRLIDLTGELA
jgi:anthranilate phosphoribosyltransferase